MRNAIGPTVVAFGAVIAGCGDAKAKGGENTGGGVVLTRDTSVGAKFGAPGPRTCSSTKQPTNGPISSADARAYVICGSEKDYQGGSENLYLLGHVQVQVSAGRPYEHVRDSIDTIDPHKRVYDIRGSSVRYSCVVPGATALPLAQQCSRTVEKSDEGKCFQTTFGEWRCTWADFNAPMSTDTRLLIPMPNVADVE